MHPNLRWFLTLAYLLLIYSTLSVVRPLAEYLRQEGILQLTMLLLFAASMVVVLLWQYKKTDKTRIIIRIILVTMIAMIALFLPGLPEERLHFLTYGLLGWMICWSFETSKQLSGRLWTSALIIVWLAGGVDELIQWKLPNRVFDMRDIIFNGTAGMLGFAIFATGGNKQKTTPGQPQT